MDTNKIKLKDIIMLVLSLILIATILPQGIAQIGNFGNEYVTINGSSVLVSTIVDANIIDIIEVVIPLVVAFVIILAYVNYIR